MAQYIDKDAVVADIERRIKINKECMLGLKNFDYYQGKVDALNDTLSLLGTLEVTEVDLEKEYKDFVEEDPVYNKLVNGIVGKAIAKHFFELGLKAQHDNWKVVDNTNFPQGDRTKIYCVFTKQHYILATVINHPKDEELLQWKCTEFPYHRYDMCEGDKYMQIV
jgi:hypothetical protein